MQKHQFSTLFILVLIAVMSVGSYAYLQKTHPYERDAIKGNWTGVASVDEVFGTRATPVETVADDSGYELTGEVVETADSGGAMDDSSEVAGLDEDSAESYVYEGGEPAYGDDDAYSADSYDADDYPAYGTEVASNSGSNKPEASAGSSKSSSGTASTAGSGKSSSSTGSSTGSSADSGKSSSNTGGGSSSSMAASSTQTSDYGTDESDDGDYGYGSSTSYDSVDDDVEPIETPTDEELHAHYRDDDSTPAPAPRARSHVEAIPAPTGANPPDADASRRWWFDPSKTRPGQFTLIYAGQLKGSPGMVLLFTRQATADSLNREAAVYDANGDRVSGSWTLSGKNPRMAKFAAAPGRYTVVVESGLQDAQGNRTGVKFNGPVYVR